VARWLLMDFYWAWWWLVGEAWAGKTALLAEAVTTLPGDVDNGDAERDACGRARTAGEVVLAELDQDGERDTYRGGLMPVSRLVHIPGIGVDEIGDAADATGNPDFLRLENLDTDVPPPALAREITHAAVEDDDANSYLPFLGHCALREAASEHVSAVTGSRYDPGTQCVSVAGGLNGILNVLLASVEPWQEVVICDPIYAGLLNRIRLAGGIPRFVRCVPGERGWVTDPGRS